MGQTQLKMDYQAVVLLERTFYEIQNVILLKAQHVYDIQQQRALHVQKV